MIGGTIQQKIPQVYLWNQLQRRCLRWQLGCENIQRLDWKNSTFLLTILSRLLKLKVIWFDKKMLPLHFGCKRQMVWCTLASNQIPFINKYRKFDEGIKSEYFYPPCWYPLLKAEALNENGDARAQCNWSTRWTQNKLSDATASGKRGK